MASFCTSVVDSWGTKLRFSLGAYLWFLIMLAFLAVLQMKRIGLYLVAPFQATLTILHLIPDAAIAQPYAVVVGSVCGASVGTLMTVAGHSVWIAIASVAIAFVVIHLLRAYHPPGVALALYPALLHPGRWFPVTVVLPFTVTAVVSATLFSRMSRHWPKYPLPLRKRSPVPQSKVDCDVYSE
ncbi:MAG: HPP family protein [Acidobacteriaceae bacterium]